MEGVGMTAGGTMVAGIIAGTENTPPLYQICSGGITS